MVGRERSESRAKPPWVGWPRKERSLHDDLAAGNIDLPPLIGLPGLDWLGGVETQDRRGNQIGARLGG